MASGLPPEMEQFVETEVSNGHFPDRDAVITHALQLLKRDRQEAIDGINLGLADVAAGRVQTLEEAIRDIKGREE
ncbi:MAG: hypothetical protein AAF394_08570 [Planctomycetota bacterium]